jgi:hypothetical protein
MARFTERGEPVTRKTNLRLSLIFAALAVASLCVSLLGCAQGSVTTSTGATVAASTVQAQDTTADILKLLSDAYMKAVQVHDSIAAVEDPAIHAKHRTLLLEVHNGLMASYAAMVTWKEVDGASGSAVPVGVLRGLGNSLAPFLDLAVQFKLITQERADQAKAFAKPILAASGGLS